MDSAAPKLSQRRSTKALTPQSTTIQLRCPDGQTSSSAHSGTRRSSSDPIRSSRPRAPMLAAPFPPASSCPSAHPTAPHRCRTPTTPFSKPCGLLRAAIPTGPVFLATADRPARRDRLRRTDEPPRRMLQQAGERDEICVTPCSPASCPCRYRTTRSIRRRRPLHRRGAIRPSKAHVVRVFQVFQMFHLDVAKIN
jgi:hypothetical protein